MVTKMRIKNYNGVKTYAKLGSEIETFPYTLSDLKADFPLVSFPSDALTQEHIRSEYGVIEVTHIESPDEVPEGKVCMRVFENRDGAWVDAWEYVEMTDEERDAHIIDSRKKDYGTAESQIEFITENGLEAWQTKVAEIKAKYPK